MLPGEKRGTCSSRDFDRVPFWLPDFLLMYAFITIYGTAEFCKVARSSPIYKIGEAGTF